MDNRYQYQTRLVKTYRWLRWKPWYFFVFLCRAFLWVITGAKRADYSCTLHDEEFGRVLTRLETLQDMWGVHKSLAHNKMEFYWRWHEIKDEIFCKFGETMKLAEQLREWQFGYQPQSRVDATFRILQDGLIRHLKFMARGCKRPNAVWRPALELHDPTEEKMEEACMLLKEWCESEGLHITIDGDRWEISWND